MIEDVTELKSYLAVPRDITIIAHRNPDGDALGSALGLRLYLEKKGHLVKVVMPSESPRIFSYLPHFYDVVVFDLKHDEARAALKNADCIFCLDFNSLDRIDKLGITCLFTGLITDTGSFKYNTRPNTYMVAAKLKMAGVDDYLLNDTIGNSLKEKNLRLLGHCLANRMEIMHEYGAALIYLTKKDYADFDIQRGDTEGIVNYMLMMKSIKVAAFITQQPSIVKISLRSKGDISVQEIASRHFKGGGHKNASGGAFYGKLSDVLDRFKRVIPDYLPKVEL